MKTFFVLLSLCAVASVASATTLLVLPDGSGPYPDLQTAVAAAADGDTILLGDGLFTGPGNRNLTVSGFSLVIRSASDDPDLCTVDLGWEAPVEDRRFLSGSGSAQDVVVVRGVTLVHGGATGGGGAVFAHDLRLVVRQCRLLDCRAYWNYGPGGGAIRQDGGVLELEDSALDENRCLNLTGSGGYGGAVSCGAAMVTIRRCTFSGNYAAGEFDTGGAGGAIAASWGTLLIEDCTFVDNHVGGSNMGSSYGGAVSVAAADAEIRGSIFAGNEVEPYGQGSAFSLYVHEGQGQARLANCTFAGNIAGVQGGTVFVRDGGLTLEACIITGAGEREEPGGDVEPGAAAAAWSGAITATDCDVWGNGQNWSGPLAGQDGHDGNFGANPCFCDTAAFDLHLCADSWCAPENNVAHPGVLVGALPVGCEACGCAQGPTAVGGNVEFAVARLLGAAPNPFNPATVIRFSLPVAGPARLVVHDLAGRRVATLVDGPCRAGEQSVTWRGRDGSGRLVAGGPYLLRLECAGEVVTRKLTLLK